MQNLTKLGINFSISMLTVSKIPQAKIQGLETLFTISAFREVRFGW